MTKINQKCSTTFFSKLDGFRVKNPGNQYGKDPESISRLCIILMIFYSESVSLRKKCYRIFPIYFHLIKTNKEFLFENIKKNFIYINKNFEDFLLEIRQLQKKILWNIFDLYSSEKDKKMFLDSKYNFSFLPYIVKKRKSQPCVVLPPVHFQIGIPLRIIKL